MLDQSISKDSLKKFGKRIRKKYKITLPYDEFIDKSVGYINNELFTGEYNFKIFGIKIFNKKVGYRFTNPNDELVINKLNNCVNRLFKVVSSDRNAIVRQIISLLKDNQPFGIVRLDIKEFYESIDRSLIIDDVVNENLLSYHNKKIIYSWDHQLSKQQVIGLPRGMSLSSTLSELRLRKFDRYFKEDSHVYYYARFVDDIIIFYTGQKEVIDESIDNAREKFIPELNFNKEKISYINFRDSSTKNKEEIIDYLGYKFIISQGKSKGRNKRNVKVLISDKKIKKIKSRVRKSFASYNRDRNFNLLFNRLKFLTGNQYIIGDIERTKLKSGIFYNYSLINDFEQLNQLDLFYKRLLNSKCEIMHSVMSKIYNYDSSPINRMKRLDKLNSLSFSFGFKKKVMNRFSYKISKKLKRCW